MKTLFVSDLDGTLLDPDQQITPFTASVINELVNKGGCFCYATARSLITARKVTKELSSPFPVICYNGAFIRDNSDGRYILKNTFEKNKILPLINELVSLGFYPIVYALINDEEKYSYIKSTLTPEQLDFIISRGDDPRDREVSTLAELTEGEIFYLSYLDSKERLAPLYKKCSGYGIRLFQKDTYDDFYWLEIMPENSTKAKAARALASLLGCDNIIAFGDGMNDLELFEEADKAFAVSNACDSLKAKSDAVIGSNDNDGVAHWLDENILTKRENSRII